MYWLHCDTCQKETVFTSINGTINCHCVKCGEVQKRPRPNTEGWGQKDIEMEKILFKLDCLDIPGVIRSVHERMPEDYTIEEVRQFFAKINRIGE